MKSLAIYVLSLTVFSATAHPLVTIRINSSRNPEAFRQIVDINRRYAGSADEYWFGRAGAGARLEIIRKEFATQVPMKAMCEQAGIAAGFQQGVTLGHGSIYDPAGGGQDKEELYPFSDEAWQVGKDGERVLMFCPRSPEVLKYEEEYAALLGEVLKPVSLWLDDDLRLGFYKKDGCFCERCIAEFNRRYGHKFRREELVERIFGKAEKEIVRRQWREYLSDSLAVYGAAARRGADRTNPECLVAYQSVNGDSMMTGKDYTALLRALSGDGKHMTSIRIGAGAYDETLSDLVQKMRSVAFEVERVKRSGVRLSAISYEQETYPRQIFHKTPEAIAVETALALANGCDAVTEYYWDERNPEPIKYYEEFAAQLSAWRGYFERLAEIARQTSLGGAARFVGKDYDLMGKENLRSPTDGNFQMLAVPITVGSSGTKVRYVDETTLGEWGEGDEERLLEGGAVALVDSKCEERLRKLGGEKVAAAFAEGRLKAFDFASCNPAKYPTHAQREALLDAFDGLKGDKLPVRYERTIPFYVYPRVDKKGSLVAVTFYNGAAGKALPAKVRLRGVLGKRVRLVRPEAKDVVLEAKESAADELTVTLPAIPARQVATVILEK